MNCVFKSFYPNSHNRISGDFVAPHEHGCYEIVYYASGFGNTTINDENCKYSEGHIALIAPNTIHDELVLEKTSAIVCLFDSQDIPQGLVNKIYKCTSEIINELNETFCLIQKEMTQCGYGFQQMLNILVQRMILFIQRLAADGDNRQFQVEYVCTYIREYCASKINFEILSENIGYSYSRFRHLFKEKAGISPMQYQLNARIVKAKKLLETTDFNVKDIGHMCGYKSGAKFVAAFKAHAATTPDKFRRILRCSTTDVVNFSADKYS